MTQCNCTEELTRLIAQYRGKKGALIPVLQKTQGLYGFLPKEALRRVAAGLDLPFSQVYGVATFYAQFHLQPRGRNIVRVCLGTACHVRGADKILAKVQEVLKIAPGETTSDQRYTIEPVACLGACGLAPVLMVNDDTHGRLTPDKIPALLANYE
jgi:NADH-quinone oxidoreductase subunit E